MTTGGERRLRAEACGDAGDQDYKERDNKFTGKIHKVTIEGRK